MIFGEQLSRNWSKERLRTATARNTDKKRFRRCLRTHCFARGPIFGRFWGSGRIPKIAKNRDFCVWGRPPERNFSQHACRSHSKRQEKAKMTKNRPKFVEKSIENGPHYENSTRPVCLQNAGVLREKSGTNSEEKRWQAICRASHLRVRRSRASVLNKKDILQHGMGDLRLTHSRGIL